MEDAGARDAAARGPFVVVSTGRCGSTLLTRMVEQAPDLLSVSELFSTLHPGAFPAGELDGPQFWEVLDRRRGRWSCLLRHRVEPAEVVLRVPREGPWSRRRGVPPVCLVALPSMTRDVVGLYEELHAAVCRLPPAAVGVQYERMLDWLAARFGKATWVERSGGSLSLLPELLAAFPRARLIHLRRDGLDTSRSMSGHTGFRMALVSYHLERMLGTDAFEDTDRARLAAVPPEWQRVLPERFEREAFLRLPIPLEDFAAFWASMECRAAGLLAPLPPERLLHVSYERLVHDPRPEAERIGSFLGIDLASAAGAAWVARAAALVAAPPERPTLPDAEAAASVCRMAEDLLRTTAAVGSRATRPGA